MSPQQVENEERSATEQQQGSVGERWRKAYEEVTRRGEQALPAVMALYDEAVHFEDPVQKLEGRAAFERLNRRLMAMSRSVEMELVDMVEREDGFFAAWKMRVAPRFGPTVTLEGTTYAKVSNGRITYHRDYFDVAGSLLSMVPVLPGLAQKAVSRLTQAF
jgi:limonene-1,2-epoxide hydrolase